MWPNWRLTSAMQQPPGELARLRSRPGGGLFKSAFSSFSPRISAPTLTGQDGAEYADSVINPRGSILCRLPRRRSQALSPERFGLTSWRFS